MTQPLFVPITTADQVRGAYMPSRSTTVVEKPAEVRTPDDHVGPMTGFHGPDQGYALTLAKRMAKRINLAPGEDLHDVEFAAAVVAGRRAAELGRAPTIYDLEVALGLFGYLGDAPADLVAYRSKAFQAIGHNYVAQRELADQIPQASLSLNPADVAVPRSDWRALVGALDA